MGLLKLSDRYSAEKLEAACSKALSYTNTPSYKSIKDLIVNLREDDNNPSIKKKDSNQYGITRGAKYYGGHNND